LLQIACPKLNASFIWLIQRGGLPVTKKTFTPNWFACVNAAIVRFEIGAACGQIVPSKSVAINFGL
jgi:hypothetical protein